MKPHILVIAQYFPPDVAGTSTRAYNAVRGLITQGCKVTVITAFPHYPDGIIPKSYRRKFCFEEQIDGARVLRTWVPPISHYTYAKRIIVHFSFIVSSLIGLFRIRNIDVIISMNPSFFCFFPAFVFKLIFKKDMIRNVDDLWPEVWYDLGIIKSKIFKRVLDWLARKSYEVPAAITPISHSYVPTLTKKYLVPENKIYVIEHGVDTDRFYRVEITRDKEHYLKSTTDNKSRMRGITFLVYSGALSVGYDFEPVLKAAKLLEKEAVHFILRGSGTSANDIENLRDMISELRLRNVEVRTDRLSAQDLIKFLNDADIFILPMSFVSGFDKGLPTKVLEYQALGKPIVCISNGEAADYVTRTRSGLVSRTRDPASIAALILRLIEESDLANSLGNSGYKYVQENLTLEKIGERFMNIILTKCQGQTEN